MARSSAVDALEKFRFIVEWSSAGAGSQLTALDRAGFLSVQMPKKSVTKIQYREGNDPDIYSLSAGLASMEDITLERGLIASAAGADKQSAMYKWMSAVQGATAGILGYDSAAGKRAGAASAAQLAAGSKEGPDSNVVYRKDLTIKVLDRTGKVARKYELYNAFPVAFNPGSDLNAGEDGDKMVESITLAYEDFKEVAV